MLNKADYKITDFGIHYAHPMGYYIAEHRNSDDVFAVAYVHRNGNLDTICGTPNFFKTKESAQRHLEKAFNHKILDEELFEI
jgi:hypothetical protein